MEVKIINADSEHAKKWINETGKLILNYPYIAIKVDSTGKYINTSKVEKIIIQTKNTKYELEVI